MVENRFEVLRPCINQDTGRKMKPGETISGLSSFEMGRHLAEGNIAPVKAAPKKRAAKRGRPKYDD